MNEPCVGHIHLRSDPDDAWKFGLISGDAAKWNFRAIPHDRDDLLPGQKDRLAEINTAKVRRLIEGLTCHPRQCGYAIAMLDAGAADMSWTMHVIRCHRGPIAVAVMEIARRGAPRRWVQETLDDIPLMDIGLPPHELVRLGLLSVAQAERMIENMPKGSGQAAMGMNINGLSKMSWTIRMIMADDDDRDRSVEMLKRLSLKGGGRRDA